MGLGLGTNRVKIVPGNAGGAGWSDTYSFNFDGVNEGFSVGTTSDIQFEYNDPFSIAFWTKPTLTSAGWVYTNFSDDANFRGIGLFVAINGKARLFIRNNGTNKIDTYADTAWTANTWCLLVVTYSGNHLASGVNFYVDGVSSTKTTTVDTLGTNTTVSTQAATIAIRTNLSSQPFPGNLDELQIFNEELSAAEAAEIWNGGSPQDPQNYSFYADMIHEWRFGDKANYSGGVWTMPDQIGSLDGTSQNMEVGDRQADVP